MDWNRSLWKSPFHNFPPKTFLDSLYPMQMSIFFTHFHISIAGELESGNYFCMQYFLNFSACILISAQSARLACRGYCCYFLLDYFFAIIFIKHDCLRPSPPPTNVPLGHMMWWRACPKLIFNAALRFFRISIRIHDRAHRRLKHFITARMKSIREHVTMCQLSSAFMTHIVIRSADSNICWFGSDHMWYGSNNVPNPMHLYCK